MNHQEPRQDFISVKRPAAPEGLRGVAVIAEAGDARRALARAALLNLAPEARVAVLMKHGPEQPGPVADRLGPAGELLAARLQRVGGHLSLISLSEGEDTAQAVASYNEQHRPELVIIAHQPKGLLASLLGSMPEKLARQGHVPVLFTQLPAQRPYRRVLVGIDYSRVCHSALALALRLKEPGSGPVDVLNCYDSGYALVLHQTGAAAEQLVDYYARQHAKAETALRAFLQPHLAQAADLRLMVRSGDPRAELEEAERELGTELLVVGRHTKQGLGYTLLGSVAEASLRRARCDVLVVPE